MEWFNEHPAVIYLNRNSLKWLQDSTYLYALGNIIPESTGWPGWPMLLLRSCGAGALCSSRLWSLTSTAPRAADKKSHLLCVCLKLFSASDTWSKRSVNIAGLFVFLLNQKCKYLLVEFSHGADRAAVSSYYKKTTRKSKNTIACTLFWDRLIMPHLFTAAKKEIDYCDISGTGAQNKARQAKSKS